MSQASAPSSEFPSESDGLIFLNCPCNIDFCFFVLHWSETLFERPSSSSPCFSADFSFPLHAELLGSSPYLQHWGVGFVDSVDWTDSLGSSPVLDRVFCCQFLSWSFLHEVVAQFQVKLC